jgi:hypothetical protein
MVLHWALVKILRKKLNKETRVMGEWLDSGKGQHSRTMHYQFGSFCKQSSCNWPCPLLTPACSDTFLLCKLKYSLKGTYWGIFAQSKNREARETVVASEWFWNICSQATTTNKIVPVATVCMQEWRYCWKQGFLWWAMLRGHKEMMKWRFKGSWKGAVIQRTWT